MHKTESAGTRSASWYSTFFVDGVGGRDSFSIVDSNAYATQAVTRSRGVPNEGAGRFCEPTRSDEKAGRLTPEERHRARAGTDYLPSSSGHVRHDQTLSKQFAPLRGEFGRTVKAPFTGAHSSQYVFGSGAPSRFPSQSQSSGSSSSR